MTYAVSWNGGQALVNRVGHAFFKARMREESAEFGDRDGRQNELDGLSVHYDDRHFNVRPSNTQPLLRLTSESLVSHGHMEYRRDQILEVIRS